MRDCSSSMRALRELLGLLKKFLSEYSVPLAFAYTLLEPLFVYLAPLLLQAVYFFILIFLLPGYAVLLLMRRHLRIRLTNQALFIPFLSLALYPLLALLVYAQYVGPFLSNIFLLSLSLKEFYAGFVALCLLPSLIEWISRRLAQLKKA